MFKKASLFDDRAKLERVNPETNERETHDVRVAYDPKNPDASNDDDLRVALNFFKQNLDVIAKFRENALSKSSMNPEQVVEDPAKMIEKLEASLKKRSS